MPKKGIVLVEKTDVQTEIEQEWNDWYDTKHIPERLKIPGFLSARRFTMIPIKDERSYKYWDNWKRLSQKPKYMTLYDLASVDVLSRQLYLEQRDREASLPADSFEAITPKLPDFSCGLYEQIFPEQEYRMPDTEVILVVGIDVLDPDKEEEFNVWYNTEHLPAMEQVPGIVTPRRFRAVETRLPTRAKLMLSGTKYLALYDVESEQVVDSEAYYKARKSPWTSWLGKFYDIRFRNVGRRIYPKS